MIVKLTYTVVARTKQQAVLHTKQHARRHAPRNPICIGRPSNRPIPCIGRQITSKLKDSREADDEHTASEQDSGDAERNRGSKEEVFTGINARGTIAGGLGRQSTQLEQEEDEILCMGWKKRNVIAGGRTRETAIDLTDDSFEFCTSKSTAPTSRVSPSFLLTVIKRLSTFQEYLPFFSPDNGFIFTHPPPLTQIKLYTQDQVCTLKVKGGHDSGSRFTWTCDAGNRRANSTATVHRDVTYLRPVMPVYTTVVCTILSANLSYSVPYTRWRNQCSTRYSAYASVTDSSTNVSTKFKDWIQIRSLCYSTIGKVLVLLVQTFVPTYRPVTIGNKNGDLQPGITRGKPVPGPAG
ncbi:hypothetical protein BT96DRAFT_946506 [Gymnopus androsaceus JB14]|uniref:Uncharacterized protein n=1 Tax=Gymnopus androsaceus JB14 TaxID=1447944 RepID=A0A6A4GVQ9_9AGAR|nr:hypothetical protein BT96DRAFT_946506 [Gymnopus androsaceus JB14]